MIFPVHHPNHSQGRAGAPSNLTLYALLCILIVYCALATLFALTTPPWQNPDEPAHYNYVAYVATERRWPVLQMGDYDEAYLQRLKDEKFAPGLSVSALRYEFHQPPLYYLLAAPVYWLSGGNLLALRLFNAALGGGIVLLVFACARVVLPDRPVIALGAAAFAAFLPMHLALMAAVNNDALAELVIAAAALALLRWQRLGDAGQGRDNPTARFHQRASCEQRRIQHRRIQHCITLSILIGLGFLTKATAYILLPVALMVVGAESVGGSRLSVRALGRQYALLITPAFLLGLPLWIRNSLVYGATDFLGLAWHDTVVSGQPTTAAWIAENGWGAYWERAWHFTAKSFWGVFGWLGVFMDARIYTGLFILSMMAAVGVVFWLRQPIKPADGWMALLLLWLGAFAAYGWYNLGFIQHQGRYLFPALPTWSLLFAVGWWAVLERRASIVAGGLLLVAAAGMAVGAMDNWTILLFGLAGGGLLLTGLLSALRRSAEKNMRLVLYGSLFLLLIALDIAIPFLYSIPQLRT